MFPLIATVWMVAVLIVLVSFGSVDNASGIMKAWVVLGIFPPVFYKLMAM